MYSTLSRCALIIRGAHAVTRRTSGAVILLATIAATSSAQHGAVRSGTVQSATTHTPLSGVYVHAGDRRAFTDSLGRFQIRLAGDSSIIHFERIGYEARAIMASALPDLILLAPRPTLLDAITVVSANTVDLSTGSALGAVRISGENIAARAGTTLAERLDATEGVSVQRMGEWGSRALIRGLGGERLTVMVDGARVNRACTFGMDQGLATIDPTTVQRVEVLSGPGSTIYGSGNVGGVINVVTRRNNLPSGWSGELRAGTATAMTGLTGGASIGYRRPRADALLSFDRNEFGDYRSGAGRVAGSAYRDASGNLTIGFVPTAAQRVSLQAQGYEGRDIGWPGMAGASIPRESRHSASMDYGIQIGKGIVDAISARAYVQRLDHHMVTSMTMPMTMPNGMTGAMESSTDARSHSVTSGGRALVRLTPGARVSVDAGIDVVEWAAEATRWTETQRIKPTTGMLSTLSLHTWPAVSVLDAGAFVQGEWSATSVLTLSAGTRIDRIGRHADSLASASDWIATGNLGLRAILPAGFSARATFGRGYRVPDPTELYGLALRPDGFIYRGTPTLASETNRNIEGSLAWSGGTPAGIAEGSITVFRNALSNLIAPRLAQGDTVSGHAVREYVNLSSAHIAGVTTSAQIDLTSLLKFRATASALRGEDDGTHEALAATPPFEGSFALRVGASARRWVEGEWQGGATQNRFSTSAGERRTPGYGIANLRAGTSISRFKVNAGVENLFDRAYRAHVDPMLLLRTGRNLYVRTSVAF